MNQKPEKMEKKTNFDTILTCLAPVWVPKLFLQVLPLLVLRHCSMLSSYTIQRKNNKPHLRKWQKN